ncbi:hypothetical protein Aeqsu_0975 [Aequorivita sublithincola DSM 14238]|uniref:Secretion system C-terminal sorting domain-containing protein n=1 Tax=Aequorivita sublithincola (strain DSM 14238 / LMG 21431 / ACAM 643 / 9-3) TaxID=746697 RepID=I3YU08_AEQSU|nr:T9SS type A sorting domain-containing protein [Aequorivita sublithincola]AFL80476.1 hypothetical protein Aeqsu_0975 [Aequorivita sublithincola DSM 14238]
MKTLIYILIFNLTAISFAQDPQLFENTWYLQNVIINGQDNFPPNNSEVNNIPLDISINQFSTQVCAPLLATVIEFSTVENTFSVIEFIQFGTDCIDQDNQQYQILYFNAFFNAQQVPGLFDYQIEVGTNTKSLTITNKDGNQAIYGDAPLSVSELQNYRFSIFPNPVKNELFLNSKNNVGNLNLKIFNIEGKLISTQTLDFEKETTVNVSNLSSGIYFLNIEDEKGNSTVKKFIKE